MRCQRCLPCARRAPLEVKSCRLLTGRGFLTGWRKSETIQREKSEEKRDNISTQSYFALRFLRKACPEQRRRANPPKESSKSVAG